MLDYQNNYEFHIENISKLDDLGYELVHLPDFPRSPCYDRKADRGWWMVIKEIAILKYIETYIDILCRDSRKLFFFDFLSSNGLCKLSITGTKEKLYLPGSTLLAACQNYTNYPSKHFTKIFANDDNPDNRDALIKRIEVINKVLVKKQHRQEIDYSIKDPCKGKIDSNKIVDDYIEELNRHAFCHYLALIDNEGMNIKYETLKKLRMSNKGKFGDLIINFPYVSINRIWGRANSEKYSKVQRSKYWDEINSFFGMDMQDIDKNCYYDTYIKQLNKLDLINIEILSISSGSDGFGYMLLFSVREREQGAEWLEIIKKYQNEFFSNTTGEEIKQYWQEIYGKKISLLNFNKTKKIRHHYRLLDKY